MTMSKMIFVNLPVSNLEVTKKFYTALGCTINPQFTDENAACIVWSEQIYVMALTHDMFKTFTPKPISDAKATTAALYALSCDTREAVDELADQALAAGGEKFNEPQDHGFMYQRSFSDPDGHTWEIFWMNSEHVEG